ncbi:MAG: hypothetical protein WAK01_00435 [Methylocystis sp.]
MQSLSPLSRCARICGLTSQELIVGASPRPEHELLATRYLRSSKAGKATMRSAMVAAIRAALQACLPRSAADILVALRLMLAKRPSPSGAQWRSHSRARRRRRRCFYASRRPVQLQHLRAAPCEKRGAASADIIILAERCAALSSSLVRG